MSARSDLRDMEDQSATIVRRVQRALLRAGAQVDDQLGIVDLIRDFARQFTIERTISHYVRSNVNRGPPQRAHAVRLHRGLTESLRVDEDSVTEEENENSMTEEEDEDSVTEEEGE